MSNLILPGNTSYNDIHVYITKKVIVEQLTEKC